MNEEAVTNDDFLVLGHLIKYNLYLLAKSQIFAALLNTMNTDDAIFETNRVIGELDLDTKRRAEMQSQPTQQFEQAEQPGAV
jgi:hypothetical protein